MAIAVRVNLLVQEKAQISGSPKMVIFQDPENGVFSGPPKNGRFSGPPKRGLFLGPEKRPFFRTWK